MKNKDQARVKRNQKRALKEARRRAARPSAQERALAKAKTQITQAVPESFDETQHLFWMCHGVNFLVSDYEKGTWTPLFEGIYEGRFPSPADVGRTIMTHFGPDSGTWPPEGLQSMAWTVQPKATVYVYYQVALHKAHQAKVENPEVEVSKPANTHAWETFNMLKTELTRKQEARKQSGLVG